MTGYSKRDVLSYVEENSVRFVRLSFCDIFGQLKNISISASELGRVFEEGCGFDASAIRGFLNVEDSDLLLFPDPGTLEPLPWRPVDHGSVIRLYCSIANPDGSPFEGDVRQHLAALEARLSQEHISMLAGLECEFYLFKNDDNGCPTLTPMDNAGYLDVAPLDKGENIRREISIMLEAMGIYVETSHHEKGPGQNEITFRPNSLMNAADDLISFKAATKTLSNRSGLYASFLPKPLLEKSGSGLHISLSCKKDKGSFGELRESVAAGILSHIQEMTLFLNPISNSYDRLGNFEAPGRMTWGEGNRDFLLRVPKARNERTDRIELRSPDPSCNPYLALLLIASAAEDGIKKDLRLSSITEGAKLPENLREAIEKAEESAFIHDALPEHLVSCFINAKKADWKKAADSGYPKLTSRDMEFPVT